MPDEHDVDCGTGLVGRMSIHVYTSFSYSYLNRARVLAESLRRHHPSWTLWAVITDEPPDGLDLDVRRFGFDHGLSASDLFGDDTERWLFSHDVVEACTAVKGAALLRILAEETAEKVLYFDPDIAVLNSLSPLVDLLDEHSIVLTPHQITPDEAANRRAILDNEVTSLGFGVYNLGFVAVRDDQTGRDFARWWADRLHDWCHDRRDIGIFVDQKWCDLVPCFFDNVKVLRDPGYNVASWNLSQRNLSFDEDGTLLVNGHPLRFFHFTKLGAVGDLMTQRYAADNFEVYELWRWYRSAVRARTLNEIPPRWWHFATFDNGIEIPKSVRVLFRERQDLRSAFRHPLKVENGFYGWLVANNYV